MSSFNGVEFNVGGQILFEGVEVAQPDLHVHLIVSATPPAATDNAPYPWTECSAAGYAPISLAANTLVIEPFTTGSIASYSAVEWEFSPFVGAEPTVYGWWIDYINGADTIPLYGGPVPTPFVIPNAGGNYVLGPFYFSQGSCAVPPPPPSGPEPIAYDQFIGTAGTLLSAHTMDKGSGWMALPTDLELGSGVAVASAAGNCGDLTDFGASDYTVSVPYTDSSNTQPALTFRYVDASNFWYVIYNRTEWAIVEVVAGVAANRMTFVDTLSPGTTYQLVLAIHGTAVELLKNAQTVIGYASMATSLTGTQFGLSLVATSGTAGGSFGPLVVV